MNSDKDAGKLTFKRWIVTVLLLTALFLPMIWFAVTLWRLA